MNDLFRRNFDSEMNGIINAVPNGAARTDVEAQLKLEAARLEGIELGKVEGRKEAEAAYHKALEDGASQERAAIQEQLAQLVAKETQTRALLERDVVEMFLGLSERLVPEILNDHALDLSVAVIRQNLEHARGQQKLKVFTNPETAEVLDRESVDWLYAEGDGIDINVKSDPKLARGAVRIEWDGGRMEYDLEAACTAIRTAFRDAVDSFKNADEKEV